MPETSTVETTAAPAGQAPAPTPTAAPTPPAEPQGDEHDPVRAKALIDKLRDEVKTAKAAAKDLESTKAKLTEYEQAQLSETEKLKAQLAEAERKATEMERKGRDALIRSAVTVAASKKNIVNPDAAFKLLNLSDIKTDSDGAPTNVDALLDALVKEMPFLLPPVGVGSAANPPRGSSGNGEDDHARRRRLLG